MIAREDSNQQPITLDLFDNGGGSDLVANDGIYSRYFTKYNGNGRYSLKCQVKGDSDTGFITEKEGTFSVQRSETDRLFKQSIHTCPGFAGGLKCSSIPLEKNVFYSSSSPKSSPS